MFNSLGALLAAIGPLYLVAVSWPLAVTDIREHRLPNKYVLPAFPITLIGQLAAGLFFASWWNLFWAAIAALVTFTVALVINRLGVLGMGDVKLMAAIALALGWYAPWLPLASLLLTFLTAGGVAIWLLISKKISLGSSMALGPYLLAGYLGAITLGAWS